MKNLITFFFSFDKLFKEKLIIPFFWLLLIVFGLSFFANALDAIKLGPLASVVEFVNWFASLLLALVTIRLIAELAVALFRINDNLSPDGGKSELADIDPVYEARKAAEAAAARTRELTKTAGEKAQEVAKSTRESAGEASHNVAERAKSTAASAKEKVSGGASVTPAKTETSVAPKKVAAKKPDAKKPVTKKAPIKKPAVKKSTAASASKKRGPKPGYKAPRDKDGNLLKKDGTPRKKPGPKKA